MFNTGFIARRYLFSKKHISLISTLTIISITGVTIGTALLIVILSVFNGFFDVIKGFLLAQDPDIRVESSTARNFRYTPQMEGQLSDIPEITIVSPYVEGKALMAYRDRKDKVITVRGVRGERLGALYNMVEHITTGSFSLGVADKKPGMVIPEQIMGEQNLHIGDQVVLFSAEGMRKTLTQFSIPRAYRFEVRGAYSSQQIVGERAVYIDLEAGQRLFDFRNTVSGLDMRLQDSDRAEQVKAQLQGSLGPDLEVSSWYDLQKPLYDVMRIEKWGSYIILMLIVLVAVLNIIGSLTMIVIQKNRDIGVLLTMGYTPGDIKKIFVKQGFYIGLIGCGIGGALGLLLSWLQKEYGIIKLSSAFILDAYPVSINPVDVIIILGGSLLLCLLASWYPARRASSVEPADAVRYE